jgi:hypothetical protein
LAAYHRYQELVKADVHNLRRSKNHPRPRKDELERIIEEFKFWCVRVCTICLIFVYNRETSPETKAIPHHALLELGIDNIGNLHVDVFHLMEGILPRVGESLILVPLGWSAKASKGRLAGLPRGLQWLENTLEDMIHPPGYTGVYHWVR